jgi:ergothioneine biosynthesis protein EgtB
VSSFVSIAARVRTPSREELLAHYARVRAATEALATPLSPEDQCVQSRPECSPTKWHRAHTTWFFETVVLGPRGAAPLDERYGRLFGTREGRGTFAAGSRATPGLVSRPSCEEIARYRREVDGLMEELVTQATPADLDELAPRIMLGLAHEQQHQEWILTDILDAFFDNPIEPTYAMSEGNEPSEPRTMPPLPIEYVPFDGGFTYIGASPCDGFHFADESPRHRVWIEPFELADRLVTVGEWKAFAESGGYETPSLWLADGYEWVRANRIDAPHYAEREGDALVSFGLDGRREVYDWEPVSHLSYYEADALARFLGGRLPTEQEWESVASTLPLEGHFLEDRTFRPAPPPAGSGGLSQIFGDAWEWTSSAYGPYPNFRAASGRGGEGASHFLLNRYVLRGGSCLSPRELVRASCRNAWPAHTRHQVTSLRVAKGIV